MKTLSEEQEAAVSSAAQTTYVVAGPGSGKSHTLIARVRRLVAEGVDPKRLFLMTFTNAGGHVFKERLAAQGIRVGFAGTLHSAMFRLIQSHGAAIGYQAGRVSLITEEERDEMLETVRKTLAPKLKKIALAPRKDTCLTTAESFDAALVLKAFARKLKIANCVDYDGVLEAGRALLDVAEVREAISFHELLVDEVQDSGEADWSIFDALPCESLFICGDPDQSIFQFRGAHPEIFTKRANDAARETPIQSALEWHSVFKLQTNYRSTFLICEAANQLIRNNTDRVQKWCVPHEDAEEGDDVRHLPSANESDEMMCIIQRLREAADQGVDWNEMAVLARTNLLVNGNPAKGSGGYRQKLRDAGIPVKEPKYAEMPPDWDRCLALIAAMYAPGNPIVVERLLRTLGKTPAQIAEWKRESDITGTALCIVADILPMTPPSLAELPTALVVQSIGRESVVLVKSRMDVLPQNEPTIGDLVADLWQHTAADSGEEGAGVHVGTIHSAKGLEFECVIVAGCEEGTLPGNERDLEEHRRLMFVAITRAKRFLYLTSAANRWKYGKPETCAPSRFITECEL